MCIDHAAIADGTSLLLAIGFRTWKCCSSRVQEETHELPDGRNLTISQKSTHVRKIMQLVYCAFASHAVLAFLCTFVGREAPNSELFGVGRRDGCHDADSPIHVITKVSGTPDYSTVLTMRKHKRVHEAITTILYWGLRRNTPVIRSEEKMASPEPCIACANDAQKTSSEFQVERHATQVSCEAECPQFDARLTGPELWACSPACEVSFAEAQSHV